jgi:hypothetical protein
MWGQNQCEHEDDVGICCGEQPNFKSVNDMRNAGIKIPECQNRCVKQAMFLTFGRKCVCVCVCVCVELILWTCLHEKPLAHTHKIEFAGNKSVGDP